MTIVLSNRGGSLRAAVMKDGRLWSYAEETLTHPAAEDIYLGRVDRCMPGLAACFVRIGETQVFLPYAEMRIPTPPRSGERVAVQIKRPPNGQKLAYATMDLCFAGKHSLLLPMSDTCAVSSRIENESERGRLYTRCLSLRPAGMGLILRSEALNASDSEILEEVRTLTEQWETLRNTAQTAPVGLLRAADGITERLLRDAKSSVDEIVTDEAPKAPWPVPFRVEADPFALFGVEAKLAAALKRRVWLPSGGNIVIDPCEAMTVIDVNTACSSGSSRDPCLNAVSVNREAAGEIARVLRVRGIGGIVLIDFIDMEREEDRTSVTDALREAFRDDPVKTVLHGFTRLGLFEMTRKREEKPLSPRDTREAQKMQ